MGELFMRAGILTTIILCFVGIIKLPFAKFKTKKPKLYKATFTVLSIFLCVYCCVITQFLIFEDKNLTTLAVLIAFTFAGVFGLYNTYEGICLKNLVKILLAKIQELFNKAPDTKYTKIIDKIGIDKALKLLEEKVEKISESVVETQPAPQPEPAKEPVVEQQTESLERNPMI